MNNEAEKILKSCGDLVRICDGGLKVSFEQLKNINSRILACEDATSQQQSAMEKYCDKVKGLDNFEFVNDFVAEYLENLQSSDKFSESEEEEHSDSNNLKRRKGGVRDLKDSVSKFQKLNNDENEEKEKKEEEDLEKATICSDIVNEFIGEAVENSVIEDNLEKEEVSESLSFQQQLGKDSKKMLKQSELNKIREMLHDYDIICEHTLECKVDLSKISEEERLLFVEQQKVFNVYAKDLSFDRNRVNFFLRFLKFGIWGSGDKKIREWFDECQLVNMMFSKCVITCNNEKFGLKIGEYSALQKLNMTVTEYQNMCKGLSVNFHFWKYHEVYKQDKDHSFSMTFFLDSCKLVSYERRNKTLCNKNDKEIQCDFMDKRDVILLMNFFFACLMVEQHTNEEDNNKVVIFGKRFQVDDFYFYVRGLNINEDGSKKSGADLACLNLREDFEFLRYQGGNGEK